MYQSPSRRETFVSDDIESFVDLHGIGVDDFAVEFLRDFDGQLGFADTRRAHYDHRKHS